MSQTKTPAAPQTVSQPPSAQQLSILQMRIRDMTTQLNTVIKTMNDENAALKKQIAGFTTKQQQTSKP